MQPYLCWQGLGRMQLRKEQHAPAREQEHSVSILMDSRNKVACNQYVLGRSLVMMCVWILPPRNVPELDRNEYVRPNGQLT